MFKIEMIEIHFTTFVEISLIFLLLFLELNVSFLLVFSNLEIKSESYFYPAFSLVLNPSHFLSLVLN